MRAFEFLVENQTPPAPRKVGREFNHLEDLVFAEHQGARRAIEILKSIAQDAKEVSHKWDGNPTVYWGRESNGQFRLVGKNNWGRPEGASNSPEELKQFILSRGKGEEWRPAFADSMAALWPIFEKGTSPDFRGYIYGDILFQPSKPFEGRDGKFIFTPNQTTYEVDHASAVGRRIAKAKVAVAAHKHLEAFGDKEGEDLTDVKSLNLNPELVVFGQTYVNHQPAVNADNLGTIEKLAATQGPKIDNFLAPVQGMGYLRDTLYTFVNTQSKAKALDKLNSNEYFNWLQSAPPKFKKIQAHSQAHPGALDAVFHLVTEIMKAKDEIIAELDSAGGDIQSHTGGKPGGEGYMHTKHGVKLVPRDRWTPFRSD
jgi:Family of unknown function (DUF6267)